MLDTGIFDSDRYFDVFVEYAKNDPEDILIEIRVCNRGPEAAMLHVLPTLWFRNTWSASPTEAKPALAQVASDNGNRVAVATHTRLGNFYLYCEGDAPLLFTDNETNNKRVFGTSNRNFYVKDGINDCVISGKRDTVNPRHEGTKVAAHYQVNLDSGKTGTIRLRLSKVAPGTMGKPFAGFAEIVQTRRRETDEYYSSITPAGVSEDTARVMRQALAGMLWTKQYFGLDVEKWLAEHGVNPMRLDGATVRNRAWSHMLNQHILSMPDKWEYPWYAAWDLGFHAMALSLVDPDFAKNQLDLLLENDFLHPTGQIPAYEWNFSDVNPPVHAWATIFLYRNEIARHGKGDLEFLKRSFRRLLLNFSWWVNRKDRFGDNVFEGGFLGLDNIGVFDRSASLPGGGHLEQADGTAWMALFCQNMIEIAIELTAYDATYTEMAEKFLNHFLGIARGMNRLGPGGMWDEEDGFYYDVLRTPDGEAKRLKVRSMVGLLPLCAISIIEPWQRERAPLVVARFWERLERTPELLREIHPTGPGHLGVGGRGIAALVNPDRLRRILSRMLDENEFLSPYGLRALSPLPCRASLCLRSRGTGVRRELSPRRIGLGDVRRQFQLARPRLDAGKCSYHSGSAQLLSVLRRQLQDRVPDRIRQSDEPLRGCARDRTSSDPHLSARPIRQAAGLRRSGEISDGSSLERLFAFLRILPWGQRRGLGRQSPDRMDWHGRNFDRSLQPAGCGAFSGDGHSKKCPWESRGGTPCGHGRVIQVSLRLIRGSGFPISA